MQSFSIKDLENLSGIKAHTIRIWEKRYNFLKPHRSETNLRIYTITELSTLLSAVLLIQYGTKVSHIDNLSPAEIESKINALAYNEARHKNKVNKLLILMAELKMIEFENLLNSIHNSEGIGTTVTEILYPFLQKTILLKQSKCFEETYYHAIDNIIRQKIIVGIEALPSIEDGIRVALFLPEGEHNELMMLMLYYFLKRKNIFTLYLGANVPLQDIEDLKHFTQADYIATHLAMVSSKFNYTKFINKLSLINHTPSVICTDVFKSHKKSPTNIYFAPDIPAAVNLIAEKKMPAKAGTFQ